MTYQQYLWAFVVQFAREKMPCSAHVLRHFDPFRLKAKLVEFATHNLANVTDALGVHSAAADVDGFLKQIYGRFIVGIDPVDHAPFVIVESGRIRQSDTEKRNAGGQNFGGMSAFHFFPKGFYTLMNILRA
jgi:hypothetical protein